MRELKVFVNDDFIISIRVDDEIIFCSPIDSVDAINIVDILCKKYTIPTGEATVSLYKFMEEIIQEIKTEKEEHLKNNTFFTGVA